jgi:sec-independent protein translocase protein TatA
MVRGQVPRGSALEQLDLRGQASVYARVCYDAADDVLPKGAAMNALDTTLSLAIGMPGPGELILILLIVLVVFGHNRIPQLGEALGKGIKNFKKSFAKDETETEPVSKTVRELPAETQDVKDRLEKVEESRVS